MRSFTVVQPSVLQMLTRSNLHLHLSGIIIRQAKPKPMLGIVHYPWRVAMAPLRIDTVFDGMVPVHQTMPCCINIRLFQHFAPCGLGDRFIHRVLASRDRLPEARTVRTFQYQDTQIFCVDDNEDGFGDFMAHAGFVQPASTASCLLQHICRPLIQTFARGLSSNVRSTMNLWRNSQHDLS